MIKISPSVLAADLSRLAEDAFNTAERLREAAMSAGALKNFREEAFSYKDKVIPLMTALRQTVDKAETIIPETAWPLPSYGEMTMKQ